MVTVAYKSTPARSDENIVVSEDVVLRITSQGFQVYVQMLSDRAILRNYYPRYLGLVRCHVAQSARPFMTSSGYPGSMAYSPGVAWSSYARYPRASG